MIVGFIILFLISLAAFTISIRSFMEKGFLFNNEYIYATDTERAKIDKKPYYKQSAVVFLLIGSIILLNAINLFFQKNWIFGIVIVIIFTTIIYAVVSSILIQKHKNK